MSPETTTRPSLKDRTVLVTGASRGIGRVIAETLHRDGARVIVHYGASREHAEALASRFGDAGFAVQADLATHSGARSLWESAEQWNGKVDVLVNNAGIYASSSVDDDSDWTSGWETNMQVNLKAPADLCRSAIRHFRATGGGIIINIASRSSHRGDDAEHLAYGAAKGGLLALTKGIARGFAHENILAYALAPGWVRTEMVDEHIATVGEEELLAGLPLGEVTPPSDVAEVVAFLASGAARHATGSTIDITGADYVR